MKNLTPKQKKLIISVISAVIVLLIALFNGSSIADALGIVTNGTTAQDTPTATPTPTPALTENVTPEPTNTSDPTDTPIPTTAPTDAPTSTPTPEPTATSAPTPTTVPTNTPTPEPTATNAPTPTDAPTATLKPTNTPKPTATPKPTNTPKPTATPKPTKAPTPALSVQENGSYTSKDEVALYIHTYNKLPKNFITKKDAENLGWVSTQGNLWDVTDHCSIGGDRFGNYEGKLPKKSGRTWYECDINYKGGKRGAERILYSNDGLIYYTNDHYETFTQLY